MIHMSRVRRVAVPAAATAAAPDGGGGNECDIGDDTDSDGVA